MVTRAMSNTKSIKKKKVHSSLVDPSRRNGITPEQFASFMDGGSFGDPGRSPTRLGGRPYMHQRLRKVDHLQGEPYQPFRLKINNKYQRLEREETLAREHDGDAQWNFYSHGKIPNRD